MSPSVLEACASGIPVISFKNPDIIKESGVNARRKTEDNFDTNNRINKIMDIYNEIRADRKVKCGKV